VSPVVELVVATGNRGKLAELKELLADLPLNVRGVHEVLPRPINVTEDGATFEENALKKASAIASATTMLTLADDSGLEVDALDGRPGVRSARFAGENATDAENNAELLRALEAMADALPQSRAKPFGARFRCVLALIDPFSEGEPVVVDGKCEGSITHTPRGSGGFGYDPLFVVEDTGKTLAELDEAAKNRVSHRGRAVMRLLPELRRIVAARQADVERVTGG